MTEVADLDPLDRRIINALQGGFPISEEPYKEAASWFDISADELISRIKSLRERGVLSRFGPLFNSEKFGGAVTLAALSVPEDRYEEVTDIVNSFEEVAHNYARTHELNMWFVVATETPEQIAEVIQDIEAKTDLHVYDCPKEKEFFIGLRLEA